MVAVVTVLSRGSNRCGEFGVVIVCIQEHQQPFIHAEGFVNTLSTSK